MVELFSILSLNKLKARSRSRPSSPEPRLRRSKRTSRSPWSETSGRSGADEDHRAGDGVGRLLRREFSRGVFEFRRSRLSFWGASQNREVEGSRGEDRCGHRRVLLPPREDQWPPG